MTSPSPINIFFAGAAHLDRCGWCDEDARLEQSNPGRFEESAGGAALNVASVIASFGAKVEIATILGKDQSAKTIKQIIKERGIKLHGQTSPSKPTASYTSITQQGGDLVIALADMAIYDDFNAAPLLPTLEKYDWLCVDANLPAKEIERLVKAAPCPVAALSVSAAKAPRLLAIVDQLEVLFTNQAEARALTGMADKTTMRQLAERLSTLGVGKAVISDGAKDIYLLNQGEITTLPVPPLSTIQDVTGAGDALAGGCLFALSKGECLPKAVEFGIQAAQEIVQVRGAYFET